MWPLVMLTSIVILLLASLFLHEDFTLVTFELSFTGDPLYILILGYDYWPSRYTVRRWILQVPPFVPQGVSTQASRA